jgi:hypothetical protein
MEKEPHADGLHERRPMAPHSYFTNRNEKG